MNTLQNELGELFDEIIVVDSLYGFVAVYVT